MAPKPIAIDNINQGGLAHSLYSGPKHSLYKLTGFDIHSEPGALKVRQKLAKNSGSTVTDLCKARVNCSNGEQYWFSSTSGKIWRCNAAGAWDLAYTTDLTFATRGENQFFDAGNPYTMDAYEFAGYIYWVTEKQIHRIAVSSATGTWSSYVTLAYAALNEDSDPDLGSGNAYTLPTSLSEVAANMNTIVFNTDIIESIMVFRDTKGTGDWTLTLHNSVNTLQGAVTVTNANVSGTLSGILFKFATPIKVIPGYSYHYHLHVSTGTSKAGVVTAATLAGSSYVAYTTSDPTYHPMREQNGVLYIGDKHFLHQIEDTYDVTSSGLYAFHGANHLFTPRALDIPQPHRVKCIGKVDTDIVVGTIISNNVSKCAVFRWNTWSVSFTSQDEVDEAGINAFLEGDNVVLVNAGLAGNIYIYDGAKLQIYKRIPGDFSKTKYGTVHPNSVGNLGGLILFGFSNGSGDPGDEGVYVMGRYSIDYPLVLDFSFPISERSGSALVVSGLEIGAILVNGFDLYVSWKNGSSYGIDKLDYDNKLEYAYFETRLIVIQRDKVTTFPKFDIGYRQMPANTSITQSYSKDHGAYVALVSINDTIHKITTAETRVESTVLQYKVQVGVSSNNAPILEPAAIYYD